MALFSSPRKMSSYFKSNDRKYLVDGPCMQEFIFERFNSKKVIQVFWRISVIFTDKTDSQNPENTENYWIHTLKTMVP